MGAVPYQALPLLRFFACKYSRAKKVRKGEGEPGNEATVGQRASFFQSLRKNLEEAATEGYTQFQKSCLLASQRIKEQYSDVPFLQDCSALRSVRRDKYSIRFLPKPLSHITPLQCYGDGNCLFRYAPDIYRHIKTLHVHTIIPNL